MPSRAARADAHFDALETRSVDEREAALRRALPAQIAHAIKHAPAFAERLRGVDAAAVTSRAALAALPVLRKSDLLARQNAADAPDAFGGFATVGWGASRPARCASGRDAPQPTVAKPPNASGASAAFWRASKSLLRSTGRAARAARDVTVAGSTPRSQAASAGARAIA